MWICCNAKEHSMLFALNLRLDEASQGPEMSRRRSDFEQMGS